MGESYYLIDQKLGVKSLATYLSKQGSLWDRIRLPPETEREKVVGSGPGPGLPITPDGELRPGVLYASSADPQVRFYLPTYELNQVNGRYTTSLKWRGPDDDPNGPLAFLTVEVSAVVPPPPRGGFRLQEIPHQALARIAYQMPVQSDGPGDVAADARPVLWIEVGALNPVGSFDPRVALLPIDRLPINQKGIRRAQLALSGKPDFDRLYQVMTDSRFNGRLQISCFATAGRRTWRQVVLGHIGLTAQSAALKDKGVLYTDLIERKSFRTPLPQTPSGLNTRKVALADNQVEPISLKQAVQLASLPAAELAKSDRPPDLPPIAAKKLSLNLQALRGANPGLFKSAALPLAGTTPARTAAAPPAAGTRPAMKLASPVMARLTPLPAAVVRPVEVAPPASPAAGLLNASALRAMAVKPVLARAYARPLPQVIGNSDILTRIGTGKIKALPVRCVVGEDGQPALLSIPVETRQEISPFFFLVDTNAHMFDIPGDMQPGKNHILIRMEVRDGAGQVMGVFYQDSAYPDQFYYQPQEFRLPRIDVPPYLPDLRVLFLDLVTRDDESAENQATLNYKVQLVYRMLPHIDPLLLELAQQQVPQVQARFIALAPQTTRLSLMVPEDETGGALTAVPRPGVDVRFDQGMVDQIELTRTEFERIFTFFQAPGGVGLDGMVEATLLGNQTAHVPVRLSLAKTTGTVFSHTYLGPIGDGVHRVRLVNRIESPVSIDALYRVALGAGVFAFPQTPPTAVVPPGGQFDLDYRLDPPTAVPADIPPALSTSIQVDAMRLWPQIFINQGYTSDTYPVRLTIAPDFFGRVPPGGNDVLSGVQVEFDDGTGVMLTAALLQEEVDLRIPLLPRLLGDPQAKKYRYRVSNFLGSDAHPGAKTDWINGEGEAALEILPAGV